MYAIVEIGGKQYRVEKDAVINVDAIAEPDTKEMSFDSVIMISDGGDVKLGRPYLDNVKVKATVLGEKKGDKVRGMKFKKRKNYTRTFGHRHLYLTLKIDDLAVS
ncbi:MAG: 50S ribosomal protein L21 [Spirochaetes bacterium]|nr:50S ribosomal protein L21 [Spirochaetota bacterium]